VNLSFTGQFQRSRMPRKRQVAGHNGAPLPPRAATTEPWMHPDTAGAASQVSWGGRPTEEGLGRSDGGSSLQQYPASRVRTSAAEGTLSSWSNEIRTQVNPLRASELLGVTYSFKVFGYLRESGRSSQSCHGGLGVQ
jgi:hypothetical protein